MSIMEYLGIGKVILGLEEENTEMQTAAERIAMAVEGAEITLLRNYYPQGNPIV